MHTTERSSPIYEKYRSKGCEKSRRKISCKSWAFTLLDKVHDSSFGRVFIQEPNAACANDCTIITIHGWPSFCSGIHNTLVIILSLTKRPRFAGSGVYRGTGPVCVTNGRFSRTRGSATVPAIGWEATLSAPSRWNRFITLVTGPAMLSSSKTTIAFRVSTSRVDHSLTANWHFYRHTVLINSRRLIDKATGRLNDLQEVLPAASNEAKDRDKRGVRCWERCSSKFLERWSLTQGKGHRDCLYCSGKVIQRRPIGERGHNPKTSNLIVYLHTVSFVLEIIFLLFDLCFIFLGEKNYLLA